MNSHSYGKIKLFMKTSCVYDTKYLYVISVETKSANVTSRCQDILAFRILSRNTSFRHKSEVK